ncbi:type II toxin-antitoxin system RelE/ParE family toxin [Candidatus Zixiibacteriota bacterium]
MIVSFRNRATEDLFYGRSTKAARRALPHQLWKVAGKRLDHLDSADQMEDLRVPPSNRLEALKGKQRKGQYSIRINDQYRICFLWIEQGPANVEVVDYHDEVK